MAVNTRKHWDHVYESRAPDRVSWYQPHAQVSLDLIARAAPPPSSRIIDVGGGASTLADGLLAHGYVDVTVLDISAAALTHARRRLGARAERVHWLEADVLAGTLPSAPYDLWHDRAVFHFLTDADDRARYLRAVRQALRPGGHVVVATFAADGPTHCSGLPVARYSAEELRAAWGPEFRLLETRREDHVTPAGVHQPFVYCLCSFAPPPGASAA